MRRLWSWLGRRGAPLVLVAMVVSGLALLGGATEAAAVIPGATAGTAVVSLYVGDVRTGGTTVGPLPGATYGIFLSRPPDTAVDANGFTTATPTFTCVSDADGDCSFIVPIGQGTGLVPQGTRMWVAAVAGPPGYYESANFQTAPLTGGVQAVTRHIWPTPPLVADQVYRSGATWMTDPGLSAPAGSPEASLTDYTRRVASDGTTALSRLDPPLPAQCGLRVALVADLSSSMVGSVPALKTAMDTFVDALRGTPSQAALFTFGTDSPANGFGPNTSLMSVATTADANAFKALYAGWGNPPTNYTNWDRGLAAVAGTNLPAADLSHFDLVVFITDGNPTVYGPNPTITGGAGYTRFRELNNAVASANLVKSQGTRVLAVGVGSGAAGNAGLNLRAISGPVAYDGTNILDASYIQTTDFTGVGNALRSVVLAQCAPSISVIKQIVPFGGTIADAYTPTEPWDFSSASLTPPATITPATSSTNPLTGATNFDVTLNGLTSGSFTVAETQKSGYSLFPTNADGTAAGTQNAACVDKSTGTDVPITVDNTGVTGFDVSLGLQSVVSCIVYNQAPDFTQASVAVDKRWRVTDAAGTTDYLNGDQPPGLQAFLDLSGPGTTPPLGQPWGEPREGYSVTSDVTVGISETPVIAPPGCTLTAVTLETGPPTASAPGTGTPLSTTSPASRQPLAAGANEWTITNQVECHSHLTLLKDVASGPADPRSWTLQAIGPPDALPGPSGRDGDATATAQEVTPDVFYQLAETADTTPAFLQDYIQLDLRSRPLLFPLSTGSWACTVTNAPSPRLLFGIEGAISVPLGVDMSCTAINDTALLNIVKRVQGGTAVPSDFTFTVTPISPILPGSRTQTVVGAPSPNGTTITVLPGQAFQITETGPPGYTLEESQSVCLTAQAILDRNNFTLLPGETAACVVTNRALSTLAVQKHDAATGDTLPGATFQLVVDSNGNGAYDPGVDQVVGTCTTDGTGTCSVGNLDFGTYFWVESAAPPGYTIPPGVAAGPIVVNAGTAGTTIATAQVSDPRALTSLSVLKVSSTDGSPLPGAVYSLFRATAATPGSDDAVVGMCTTNGAGLCSIGGLDFGTYYWVETAAPPGYTVPSDVNSDVITITADNAGTTLVPTKFTDDPVGGTGDLPATGVTAMWTGPVGALFVVLGIGLVLVVRRYREWRS
jgi:hypothetical protein